MKVIYKLVELQKYRVPRYCPHDGAGLEYVDEYLYKGNNILYEVLRCPECGRLYVIRKLKEVREEVKEKGDE